MIQLKKRFFFQSTFILFLAHSKDLALQNFKFSPDFTPGKELIRT